MDGYYHEIKGLYDPASERDSCGVGFIVNITGLKLNKIVKDGIHMLERLAHRGAVGADPKTGDGAGILIQIPHKFFQKAAKQAGIELPGAGEYGTGLIFLPRDAADRMAVKKEIKKAIESKGQKLLGWREVPVDDSVIGDVARENEPAFEQVFIKKAQEVRGQEEFERILYIIRKKAENAVRPLEFGQKHYFYITNLSSRVFIYKGLMMPQQIADFFIDLKDQSIVSAICLVHSRYSTNTFPTWDLAQPFRFIAHNGEINTLRGNINWMKGREGLFKSSVFGEDTAHLKPVIRDERQSDSASIDNAFELLTMAGRSMPHSMMMLVPEAWEHNKMLPNSIRSFYKYHACFMEPWDGPAALAFTDGVRVGAVLDRNGLRPARYLVTNDDYVVMSSEVGVLDIEPGNIKQSGRLEPGKIFYIDTEKGRIITDQEIKEELARRAPYRQWRKEQLVYLEDLPRQEAKESDPEELFGRLKVFGYTREDMKDILKPMADEAKDPLGSMGNDTPHAVLSARPRLLYNYFKQLFAQVTNPPIDSEREDMVMSLRSFMGPRKNLFDETAQHTHKLQVMEPIITNEELAKIKNIAVNGFKTRTITLLYMPGGEKRLIDALDRVCEEAVNAVNDGYSFILLSDRGVTEEYAAIPALLAVGAVHQQLVKKSLRTHASLILESGEPREVHHMCVLLGFGVGVINPYLAYDAIKYMSDKGELGTGYETALENYRKTCHKGIRKVMAKMGISTVQSYRGAQIFEALGLHDEIIDRCFTGCASRIGGAGFKEIAREVEMTHAAAYKKTGVEDNLLATGGIYQWKKDGEAHLWNPDSIAALQDAARNNDWNRFKDFTRLIDDQSAQPVTLRGLLKFKWAEPVPVDEVEPVDSIVKRFVIGAMSFGSISRPAHETMAIAMNRLGGKSNTGEGGEDPARFNPYPNGDSARSAVKQVASGRFGVTINYLTNADELQIKIAQGAKPGEGGQLPGHKVSEQIARTRYTTPGVTLISPPPHHDIYSIEDLKQLIFDLKNANPRARISVKLVSEIGVGTVAAGVAKGHADMILISGGDGGTGASPKTSIMHAGLPWELGLSEAHQTLVLNNLRGRVRLQADGQMRTGRDVAIAACLGAEEFGFGTAALITLGCVMLRHCHLNNCALGIATQEEILQKRFAGRPEYLMNFLRFVARDLREIMASIGIRTVNELVGRADLLELNRSILPWKASGIDYSRLLYRPEVPASVDTYCKKAQDHEIDQVLDKHLISAAKNALDNAQPVEIESKICNTDRAVGAMLSGEVCRKYGEEYLPEDTIKVKFTGIAGQSFGAFLARGVTFELMGMANDYVGKGLSGGRIIIYPDRGAPYSAGDNIIMGNTTFYGATAGEAYINGVAGERFCIRNSGLYAVVEGAGDHGCEYMTGGRVVVIGLTGRNFAAGMSGGIAYVLNDDHNFAEKCNTSMVELTAVDKDDGKIIYDMLTEHVKYTGSKRAAEILEDFQQALRKFIKVYPLEYKQVLEQRNAGKKLETKEA
jgi:glutamate synthase (NADPH) large chain